MQITEFFKNLINTILDGSLERVRVVNAMNESFRQAFMTGELNRLCKTSISYGDLDYRHPMSSYWMRSGFRISIQNDSQMKDSEYNEISQYILQNNTFVRQLMAMGFDTLKISGAISKKEKQYALKNYADLDSYYLN